MKTFFLIQNPSCSVIPKEALLGQMPSAIIIAYFSVSKGCTIPVAIKALQYRS